VIALAAFRVGAIVNPLMPIFRKHELSYMLDFVELKAPAAIGTPRMANSSARP
jgi:acyl-coenzyme A synthetase/AMP-(fatty) acid ligase